MSDALSKLIDAALAERDQILAEIANIDAQRAEKQEALKRYEKVLAAYGLNGTNGNPAPKAPPKKPKKQDWRVSSGMLEQVFDHMTVEAQNGTQEFTIKDLSTSLKISDMTASKALHILHEQGRVRLLRKHRQQRFWGVVTP
jgi:ribosomal protein S25